jgi:hypothetical protein
MFAARRVATLDRNSAHRVHVMAVSADMGVRLRRSLGQCLDLVERLMNRKERLPPSRRAAVGRHMDQDLIDLIDRDAVTYRTLCVDAKFLMAPQTGKNAQRENETTSPVKSRTAP